MNLCFSFKLIINSLSLQRTLKFYSLLAYIIYILNSREPSLESRSNGSLVEVITCKTGFETRVN